MASGFELTGKTDLRFTETLFKVLRDIFHYKPTLTKEQFLKFGFSQRKISLICDVIDLVLQKKRQMKKTKVKHTRASKDSKEERRPPPTDADTVSEMASGLAIGGNPSTNAKRFQACSHSPEAVVTELTGWNVSTGNLEKLVWTDVERRLSAVEAQVQSLPVVHRLNVLEKRLEELEKQRDPEKNKREMVNISRESWQNLMTRVLLLETKLELGKAQGIELQPKDNLTHEKSPS
ncbi:centrosomal protein of 44 kDa isoform X3 [Takifugu rubripes]|nr:centrosomal protein of 44 kDa isoform X3 [Takifugu rubripes]XP_029687783.1 centrosomal protein of 44 kDa isoform X3 [Takifugu rubripes]XP_056869249.1 centrosomal protein of 44 kDa isoform X3 [Takifugu flavidus]XP_056869250.1 centrosomal protein of 44 kDa isoform X3 [Takifugu flavidus]XP_056869251.1 centrosomal protein of 44 kDa isoform X3 [Takifugu flavidus]